MKYPGEFILYEVGTNKQIASAYGVSERTVYRWKNKAMKETGARVKKPTRPRVSTLQKFKGTRKELAKKYGVSERTAYRWIADAKQKGADIESRQKKSKYPGAEILIESGTNKDLAKKYNVSEKTIRRWKNRASNEIDEPFEVTPLFGKQKPFENLLQDGVSSAFDDFAKDFEEDMSQMNFGSEFDMPFEVEPLPEFSDAYKQQIDDIISILDNANLITKNSLFNDLNPELKQIYIDEYIQFQWEENPYQFNQSPPDDPNGPDISDPEKISNINIWGQDFELWLKNQLLIDNT